MSNAMNLYSVVCHAYMLWRNWGGAGMARALGAKFGGAIFMVLCLKMQKFHFPFMTVLSRGAIFLIALGAIKPSYASVYMF